MNSFVSIPLRRYQESHTRLNNYIKIATVATDYLFNSSEDNKDLSKRINALILEAGERWTPREFENPKNNLEIVKNEIIMSGIIWVYSSFDVFFKQVEGSLSNCFVLAENDDESDADSPEQKIQRFYRKLNWDSNAIESILPIFSFFKELRNCVAHNEGKPNERIKRISESDQFTNAIASWQTKFNINPISDPPIIRDGSMLLRPHHAIFYSETCLRIAKDINAKLYATLGLKHFILKTFKHHLESDGLTQPFCQDFYKYIAFHLRQDYCIKLKDNRDIDEYFKSEEEKLAYKKKYNRLKTTS